MDADSCARRRSAYLRCISAFCLACSTNCGVHEHPHPQATVDTSDDFGPSRVTTARSFSFDFGFKAEVDAGPSERMHTEGSDAGTPVSASRHSAPNSSMMTAPPTTKVMTTAGSSADAGAAGHAAVPMAGAPEAGAAGAPVPRSGITIQLGTEIVAKEDVIAFIHIGHSNMAGRSSTPTELRPYFFDETDPHAWMYHAGTPPELAKEPFTAGDEIARMENYGGPGTPLLKQAVEMAPHKYFLSLGFGQSNAWCSQYLPGALYYDPMMAAPKAIKDRVTFGAIVIMLGITERDGGPMDPAAYPECINKLVTAIRTDLGQPDLPLLLTDYEQGAAGDFTVGLPIANQIIPEIHKVPGVVKNSVIVPTDGVPMQDNHHFDLTGQKMWTKRVLDLMKDNGWFPWAE